MSQPLGRRRTASFPPAAARGGQPGKCKISLHMHSHNRLICNLILPGTCGTPLVVPNGGCASPRFKHDDLVPVRVAYDEVELRQQLRAMRGRWDAERKLWYVRYGLIRGTPLEKRLAELYG